MVIKNVFMEVLPDVWPMLIIILVIIVSLRLTYLITKHKKFQLHKEIIYLLAIIYLLCLFHVVTFQDSNYGTSNFTPFKEIFRYNFGSKLFIKNIVGNVLLYMPFGLFVSAYLDNKKIFPIFILALISSVSIEFVQLAIGRVFDVDDIILNVLGATFGALLYIILDGIRDKLPSALNKEWFMNLLMIILLLVAIIYLTNIQVYLYEMVM